MKVAIAGATGFVGQRLVQRLSQDNHSLVLLTREASRARSRFPEASYPNAEIVTYTPRESGDWQGEIGRAHV